MKYILLGLLITSISCRKELSCEKCIVTGIKNATIIYAGDPAWDGCGWLVKIDSTIYHADLLDSAYMQNQLPVKIVYELAPGKYFCSLGPLELPDIHLISITK